MRFSDCHPDRKHVAKGLCQQCYSSKISKNRQINRTHQYHKRDLINSLKAHPCTDCGQTFPPCVMEWDHIKDKKDFSIGMAVNANKSYEELLKEISKCELVCSNCHRLRTCKRGNHQHTN